MNIRKGCREVLAEAGKYFEVAVFTASEPPYANAILDYIDPDHTLVHHRLFRDSCIPVIHKDSGK